MAYSVINIYDDKLNSKRDLLCDDTSDIDSLPTQSTETEEFPEGTGTGSTAIVTGTPLIYILGNQGTWTQLCAIGGGGGGGGGGGSVLIPTPIEVSVTGGYNGGAQLAVILGGETIFTATGDSPYNLHYDTEHAIVNTTYGDVTIDVTPPADSTSLLYVSASLGTNSHEWTIPHLGSNTSFGYNYSGNCYWLISVPGSFVILPRAEWNALTTAQKQSYEYVAIQDTMSGFNRGELVYGADYPDALRIWTKSTGSYDAAMYWQLGRVVEGVFVGVSAQNTLVYTNAANWVNCALAAIKYGNTSWQVKALVPVFYNGNSYAAEAIVDTWTYPTSKDMLLTVQEGS